MIGRRGFLGTLLAGAGLIALDVERELWKPGKLISIPPRVHLPQTHHLWVSQDYARGYRPERDDESMSKHLAFEVDSLVAKAGGRRAVFLPMIAPRQAITSHATQEAIVMLGATDNGVEYLSFGPQGRLPIALVREAYDARRGAWLRSMNIRVRI